MRARSPIARVHWLVSFLAVVSAGMSPVAAADDLDLDTIIEAQENAVGLIHAIDVRMDFEGENRPDTRTTKGPLTFTWRWSSEGERERMRIQTDYFPPTPDGRPTNLTDTYQDGRQRWTLANYDPKNPQQVTPVKQGTLRASVEPQMRTRSTRFPDPRPYLGLCVQFNDRDLVRSLREMRKAYPKVELIGKVPYKDHIVWRIRAEPPGNDPKNYMEIDCDPTKNFNIRRVTAHNGGYQVTGGGNMPFVSVREMLDYYEGADGVFIPTRFEERVEFPESGSSVLLHGKVTVNALNTKMPQDAFDFRFPKFAVVRHLPPEGLKVTVDVWGDDGPIFTTNDTGRLVAYARENGFDTARPASSLDYPVLVSILILTMILVILVVRGIRRRMAS